MDAFDASQWDIRPRELVDFLLEESGQKKRDSINPAQILEALSLQYLAFDFAAVLPTEATDSRKAPRALLCFRERVVATDTAMRDQRIRFSILHEIAHYILPTHQHALYLCDDTDLAGMTQLVLEKQANAFAADLLFMGDRFTLEANSHQICAPTVKTLAIKYEASFEATARRLVERNIRPCMLAVFHRENSRSVVNPDLPTKWVLKYSIASSALSTSCLKEIHRAEVPAKIAAILTKTGHDIADSIIVDVPIKLPNGSTQPFQGEYFSNHHNIFCLLTPAGAD